MTIAERDLSDLHSRLLILDPAQKKPPKSVTAADQNSSLLDDLMAGRWQGQYPSQSEADLALCTLLARKYNGDRQKIDEEFRKSRLSRDKWEQRPDYRERTINKAIEKVRTPECGVQEYESEEARAGSGGLPPDAEALDWRPSFKSYDQLEQGDLQFLIPGFLPAGVTFITGLPGAGKTWVCLSIAKALVTGQRFLGHYELPSSIPVIYLTPEVGDRAFRSRLETMRLSGAGDSFICRTMKDDVCKLDEPNLVAAVRTLRPVIVLDTLSRFSTAQDENSASDNRVLANGIFGLLKTGAQAVIAVHHAVKGSEGERRLTLKTALRGSGDLGAIADAVWGVQCDDHDKLSLKLQCVKARDFEIPRPIDILGRPYINQKGDFVVKEGLRSDREKSEVEALKKHVQENPSATYDDVSEATHIPRKRIKRVAESAGWRKKNGRGWEQIPLLDKA
jgi:hypothetical protein